MIEKMQQIDLEQIMKIWLETNLSAHSFIAKNFWQEHYEEVKKLLPQAEIWIYKEENQIKGFIGIVDSNYIAGLFVQQESQSNGIGGQLVEYAKLHYKNLCLDVYVKNQKAFTFYESHGFTVQEEKQNQDTGEKEYFMVWKSNEI